MEIQPGDEWPMLAYFARVGFHRLAWRGLSSKSDRVIRRTPKDPTLSQKVKEWGTLDSWSCGVNICAP